jgi:hypothetical protein
VALVEDIFDLIRDQQDGQAARRERIDGLEITGLSPILFI